jgi:hypothetical protein
MVEVKMEKGLVKVKKYLGTAADADGWQTVGDVGVADGVRWVLYVSKTHKNGWWNAKLSAKGWAPVKANYWLAWNGERLAMTKDRKRLIEERPGLEEKVSKMFMEGLPR